MKFLILEHLEKSRIPVEECKVALELVNFNQKVMAMIVDRQASLETGGEREAQSVRGEFQEA